MPALYKADKTTVAGCQLDTAIELLFGGKDIISAAVLIHGAWNIARDILAKKGGESSRMWMKEIFPDLTEREIYGKLHEVWNFCKHADTDAEKLIQFPLGYVEAALMLALYDFSQVSSVKSQTMEAYELWFIAKNEEMFKNHEVFTDASRVFPNLSALKPSEQAKVGSNFISSLR